MAFTTQFASIVFALSLMTLFYVYLGYPLLLAIMALFARRGKAQPDYFPSISILVAAYNEEQGIARKLTDTLALNYPAGKCEILVLSDGSTDRTDEIVKSFRNPRVRLIRVSGRKGKTYAQNIGVGEAKGEILVFSDATTVYDPNALRYLAANYRDPEVGAVSGRYDYVDCTKGSPTARGQMTFWSYENIIKALQSRIYTITGCCGCIYSLRKKLYTALPADLISDLTQALCVVHKGYRVVFEDRARAFEETTASAGQEFRMRVRVVTRGMRGLLAVPELLIPWRHPWISFQLWSHKVLRWLVPVPLALLFASNALLLSSPLFTGTFIVQLAFYSLTLIGTVAPLHKYWKPLAIPLYFCTVNVAAFASILSVLRGKNYVVWETVR